MSKDTYSDEKTIEVLNNDLNISTGNSNSVNILSSQAATSYTSGALKSIGGISTENNVYIEGYAYTDRLYSNSLDIISSTDIEISNNLSIFTPYNINIENNSFGGNVQLINNAVSGDINIQTLSASGDINLTSGRNLNLSISDEIYSAVDLDINSDLDILLTAGDDIRLESSDEISISSSNPILIATNSPISQIGQARIWASEYETYYSRGVICDIYSSQSSDTALLISHDSTSSSGASVAIVNSSSTGDNVYISFQRRISSLSYSITGKIRGSDASAVSAFRAQGPGQEALRAVGDVVETNAAGDIVYASGNADFGEWIECGDLSEWPEYTHKKNINTPNNVGLEEGIVVYIRNNKFYRSGYGCPALISNSAMIIGNEVDFKDDWYGEVISFAGQIKVIVKGICKSGDCLIPEDGTNYCYAKSKDDISFDEYKKSLGSIIEDSDDERLKYVTCAIGIK